MHVYLTPLLREFPLELCHGAWAHKKTKIKELPYKKQVDDIFSRLDTIYECDRQTDTGRRLQYRAFA